MPAKGPDEKFCSECGEAIKIKAEICPKCGVRQISGQGNPASPYSGGVGEGNFVAGFPVRHGVGKWCYLMCAKDKMVLKIASTPNILIWLLVIITTPIGPLFLYLYTSSAQKKCIAEALRIGDYNDPLRAPTDTIIPAEEIKNISFGGWSGNWVSVNHSKGTFSFYLENKAEAQRLAKIYPHFSGGY